MAFLSLFDSAAGYYKRAVGREANPWPGENREGQISYNVIPETGRQLPGDESLNVIGLNKSLTGDFVTDFPRQGGSLSKALNIIPTMNATAALHDYWFNSGQLEFSTFNNVSTMLPASVISIGASVGNLVQGWQSSPMAWHILTEPYEDKR